MKSSDTAQIFFEDVRVPCKYLIGEEGMGFTYQMLQFQEERLWAVANGKLLILLGRVQDSQKTTKNFILIYDKILWWLIGQILDTEGFLCISWPKTKQKGISGKHCRGSVKLLFSLEPSNNKQQNEDAVLKMCGLQIEHKGYYIMEKITNLDLP